MRSTCTYWLLALGMTGSVISCGHVHPNREPGSTVNIPDTYSLFSEHEAVQTPWWEHFHSDELTRFVEEALSHGFTIKEAYFRLHQMRAQAQIARSDSYPDLRLNTTGRYTDRGTSGGSSNGLATSNAASRSTNLIGQSQELYALGLASAYEIDLWGRVRASAQASTLEAEASREDFDTAAMTIAAQVAETWIQIVTQRAQQSLLEKQLETNREILNLLELRFRNSMANALDVYQQQQVLAEVEAAVPLVEAQEATLTHKLAILLGRPPRSNLNIKTVRLPAFLGRLPIGIPAQLLSQRPDIRAAGKRLHAADYRVAAARAERLPSLRITADAGYENNELQSLFDNWILNLSGNLVGPLLDAGGRRAQVDRSIAVADERLSAYRRIVFEAIRDVEDALVRENKQIEHAQAIHHQIDVARRALNEATTRYQNGISDYLPVLTQLLSVQRLERTFVDKNSEQYLFRIALYRALGGTWMSPSIVDSSHQNSTRTRSKNIDKSEINAASEPMH